MIRLAGPGDAAQVAAIYAPHVTGASTSFEYAPPDAAEMAARIASTRAHAPYLVLETGGGVLGFAYASKHRERAAYQWSVDVSVYVHERAHRRGVGRALYESLFALLRLQGFYSAHAGITLPNPASVGLHEALGFRPVGVRKNYYAETKEDALVMWAEDVAGEEYAKLLDSVEAGVPGTTDVEEQPL